MLLKMLKTPQCISQGPASRAEQLILITSLKPCLSADGMRARELVEHPFLPRRLGLEALMLVNWGAVIGLFTTLITGLYSQAGNEPISSTDSRGTHLSGHGT